MKEIFFTSDTHFGTNKALARENRPFRNWKVFYRKTIKQWNKQAKKDDLIYHLGDFIDYVPVRKQLEVLFKSCQKYKSKCCFDYREQ